MGDKIVAPNFVNRRPLVGFPRQAISNFFCLFVRFYVSLIRSVFFVFVSFLYLSFFLSYFTIYNHTRRHI